MAEVKTFQVESISLGSKVDGDRIVFKSLQDLENAYKEIDLGKDIYVQDKDGFITKLLHQMISAKIYAGTILLSARKEEVK